MENNPLRKKRSESITGLMYQKMGLGMIKGQDIIHFLAKMSHLQQDLLKVSKKELPASLFALKLLNESIILLNLPNLYFKGDLGFLERGALVLGSVGGLWNFSSGPGKSIFRSKYFLVPVISLRHLRLLYNISHHYL
jgi:hypothetical protein